MVVLTPYVQFASVEDRGIEGSVFDPLFPQIEDPLAGSSEHRQALNFIAEPSAMKSHRSAVDFLLCGIFPFLSGSCQRYYAQHYSRLGDMILIEQETHCNAGLLAALDLAQELFRKDQRIDLKQFFNEVRQKLAA